MTHYLRFFLSLLFLFFGLNMLAQSNVTKMESSTSKIKHIHNKKLILVTPTTVVKNESDQRKYPKKPKREKKNIEQKGQKPPKIKQVIIDEKNSSR